MGIEALIRGEMSVRPLQELHAALRADPRDGRSSGRSAAGAVPVGGGDAEAAHEWTLRRLGRAAAGRPAALAALRGRVRGRARRAAVFGVDFPNPVGLAAGMDKDGRGAGRLAGARVRLRRGRHRHRGTRSRATSGRGCSGCPRSEAIVNRMGFNNAGARGAGAPRLRRRPRPAAGAAGHQPRQVQGHAAGGRGRRLRGSRCERCATHGDYFAVNVSARPTRPACARCRTGTHLDALPAPPLVRGRPAAAGEDRAGPHRRGASPTLLEVVPRARRGRGDRHQHDARPGRAGAGRRARRRGGRAVRPPADRARPRGGGVRPPRDRRAAAGRSASAASSTPTTPRGCSTPAPRWCSSTPASSTAGRRWCGPSRGRLDDAGGGPGRRPGAGLASVRPDAVDHAAVRRGERARGTPAPGRRPRAGRRHVVVVVGHPRLPPPGAGRRRRRPDDPDEPRDVRRPHPRAGRAARADAGRAERPRPRLPLRLRLGERRGRDQDGAAVPARPRPPGEAPPRDVAGRLPRRHVPPDERLRPRGRHARAVDRRAARPGVRAGAAGGLHLGVRRRAAGR